MEWAIWLALPSASADLADTMICLSFDTDHMDDARMAEFLGRVAIPGRGTFFCTQAYDSLAQTRHELAPHPFLANNNHDEELRQKRQQFPVATGWRSHSCVFSHILAEWLGRNGYCYVSTHDQFGATGIQPTRHLWGVWHLPIYYMDNMDFSRHRFSKDASVTPFSPHLIQQAIQEDGLYVFDFHPIHLLLNTPNADFYFSARERFLKGEEIDRLRYDGYGTESYFIDLCSKMRAAGMASHGMQQALESFIGSGRLSVG